jgi:hypothetical protein
LTGGERALQAPSIYGFRDPMSPDPVAKVDGDNGARRPTGAAPAPAYALAITMVVLVHLEIWGVHGGAHLLLAIAGFTFARFS